MDIFSNATLREAKHRFQSPRVITLHHVEVLYPDGSVGYFDESGDLSSNRDDCRQFTHDDFHTAEVVYLLLCGQGLDASIETSQRVLQ